MELKEYQTRALDAFARWRDALETARLESLEDIEHYTRRNRPVPEEVRNYPKAAWQQLAAAGEVPYPQREYVNRTAAAGYAIPHLCFKVPTGGGKTLLAAAALERLNRPAGLVLWLVPSNAIYQQTKKALWNREHPYRQMLERASGGRVKLLEKDDLFSAADLAHYLCVMLISLQSANRTNNKDFLRMFRDSGRYPTLFPDSDDALADGRLLERCPDLEREGDNGPVKRSLVNVFKLYRPVMVLDEAHKAYGPAERGSDQFVQAISRLNPSTIIELSATPNARRSNLLVDISGVDLKTEEMIKLPVRVTSYEKTDWQYTLGEAQAQLDLLAAAAQSFQHNSGRYIRPIAVVRVERTGKDQRDGERIHAEDVRQYLTESLGVPAAAVAVQSGEVKELAGVDLLSPFAPVRWIITKAALMEGWDCPFAYLLVMLDNTSAKTAITQLVGRVMRQPQARRTGRQLLDECYVYCQDTDVGNAVQYVKDGLEREGMTGLDDEVRSGQPLNLKTVAIQRRERFREMEIFLPLVLHRYGKDAWTELDYQRHIRPGIDFDAIHARDFQTGMAGDPRASHADVDVDPASPSAVFYAPQELQIDTSVKIAWYARRLSDVLTNPWQAARMAGEMIDRLRAEGKDDAAIYRQRSQLVEWLRQTAAKQIEKQAEKEFRRKLDAGAIRFDLETGNNYRLRQSYELPVAENDHQLQRHGETVQLSLFAPVYAKDFNDSERRFAFWLDEQKALQWWHRVAARQTGDYYLRGWRRERIWPDFVAMAGESQGKPSVLVFETKGQHLEKYDDTKYKKRVFAALEETFNAGKMTIRDGPAKGIFRLVFDREGAGFPEAAEAMESLAGTYKV